ncbi:50S ribosomal protein L5 [soil metagenome]
MDTTNPETTDTATTDAPVSLRQKYKDSIVAELQKRHDYANVMAVPKLEKIVINMGLGAAREDSKVLDKAGRELAQIALQRPVVTKAKKSVSNFKLRAGMPIGVMVTLRGERMWVFLEKLVNIALPRVRDFRGINPNSFDGRGNYSMGVREQLVFPEISYDQIDAVRGMDVSIVTTAATDEEARDLLELLGMPFRK